MLAPAVPRYIGAYIGEQEGSLPPHLGGRTDPDCCLCLWPEQQCSVSTLLEVFRDAATVRPEGVYLGRMDPDLTLSGVLSSISHSLITFMGS